jgi:hypothetical protein
MAVLDNRPQLQFLLDKLVAVPPVILSKFDPDGDGTYPLLREELDTSIAWVEDVASTKFNPVQTTIAEPELYDGNGTNQIVTRKRPAISVQNLQVETPILGYIRVYTPSEIKLYVKQGVVKVFTYKLAVEQALMQSVDYQAWGSLFPPLPQCVQLAYTYGFEQYDPLADQEALGIGTGTGATTDDMGITWTPGDTRDPELLNWLKNLQEAAVCEAAAKFLGQSAGLIVGIAQSVSFDGYSRSLNPQAFASQIAALTARRDELLARRKRQFYMTTLGSTSY